MHAAENILPEFDLVGLSDAEGRDYSLRLYSAAEPQACVVVAPGGLCSGERYDWLGKELSVNGFSVVVIDPPFRPIPGGAVSGDLKDVQWIAISDIAESLRWVQSRYPAIPMFAVGHSLGGTSLLEGFDEREARSNPRAQFDDADFEPFQKIESVVVLGGHLQPEAFGRRLDYRHESIPLQKPHGASLLLVAAENDVAAPPDLVRKTAQRYGDDVQFVLLEGGNHMNWAEGDDPFRSDDFGGVATITSERQRTLTLDHIFSFFEGKIAP